MSNQDQKAIVITGSSSGLGRATAKLFAAKEWRVIASMRNPDKEKELAKTSGVTLMALDITEPQQIESVVQEVVGSGGVDVVFNNAGYGLAGALEGLTDEQILRMVNTNMLGAIRTTKAFIPYSRQKRTRLFINTTSIGGLLRRSFQLHLSRHEMGEGWSESMAFELNEFGIGIKTIEPGGMKTDFSTRSFDTGRHPAYDYS
jgi:NAD(P)-dependent dehydrogenase (short-subunit alcohol dehydrogenase family)